MARTQGSHSDITGPRVRDAALKLFAQHGFAAVSMRQIAGEVGVQAGALYNYTPDKQTLLYTLLKGHMEDLLAARVAARIEGPALDKLEAFTRFHITYHLERPEAVFISYMELRNLSPANFASVERLRRQYEDELEAVLRAGLDEGTMHVSDTKLSAMALIAMLTGVTTWYRQEGRLSKDDISESYWEMVRGCVGAAAL